MRTPIELINLYWDEVWNNGNVELVREICADPIIRHDPGAVTSLSHDAQIERISHQLARRPLFTHEVLIADEHHVCSVWNMKIRTGGERELCGIEVFRVEEGRLSRAWNSSYQSGYWGRDGDASVPSDLPPPAILSALSEIDIDWVQKVLASAGLAAPRVGTMVSVDAIGQGTLSETARATFVYNAPPQSFPTSLVCKFNRTSEAISQANKRLGFYEREIETYRFLATQDGLSVPKIYFASMSPDGASSNVVLEDLTGRTRPGDQVKGCGVEDAEAVLSSIGEIHSRFAGQPAPEWTLDRTRLGDVLATSYRLGADALRDFLGAALTKEEYAVIDRFGELYETWAAIPPAFPTVLHGDLRVDNVLFEDGDSVRAWLIDWQMTAFGSPQFDLAYFLTGSVDVETRRAKEKDWIARHWEQLPTEGTGYELAAAESEFQLQAVAGLGATVAASRTIQRTDGAAALLTALAQRNCAAIVDWNSLDAIAAHSA